MIRNGTVSASISMAEIDDSTNFQTEFLLKSKVPRPRTPPRNVQAM
jgi:hypothetical protein